VTALDGIDLTISSGIVFGLLGANGSGESTLIRVLSMLTTPIAGRAMVHGVDVVSDAAKVRELIGVTGQDTTLDLRLGGRENLQVFGRLHRLSPKAARANASELLDRYGLAEAGDRPVRTYSGGMRRRLDIVSGLILQPALLLLDEPTTGLDPRSRNDIWVAVRELADGGNQHFPDDAVPR
jgi:ABC-2 type transport system ATP-binding protein